MALNFLTLNAKGLNHLAKHRSLWKEALQHNCDILCIQETHFASKSPPKCTHPKFSFINYANADVKKKGVMVAIRDTVVFKIHKITVDPQGRFIILVCDINSNTYTVANIYAPNTRHIRFVNKTMKKIRSIQQGMLVLCRDFSILPDPVLDSTSKPKRLPSSLNSVIHNHELYDSWRCLNVN